jgi:hypothetical protein
MFGCVIEIKFQSVFSFRNVLKNYFKKLFLILAHQNDKKKTL